MEIPHWTVHYIFVRNQVTHSIIKKYLENQKKYHFILYLSITIFLKKSCNKLISIYKTKKILP
jgi:hypothetical protein